MSLVALLCPTVLTSLCSRTYGCRVLRLAGCGEMPVFRHTSAHTGRCHNVLPYYPHLEIRNQPSEPPDTRWFLVRPIFDPEDRDETFLRSVDSFADSTALYPRRWQHALIAAVRTSPYNVQYKL
jgi:hypothetical protein